MKAISILFFRSEITPTFIDEACRVLNRIIDLEASGTFHSVCSDLTSPYEFADYFLEKARGVKGVVREGKMKDFLSVAGRVPRPRLGGLTTAETQKRLKMNFETWREAIDVLVTQLNFS